MKNLFRITASALIVASALSASAQSNVQKTAAEAAEAIANAPKTNSAAPKKNYWTNSVDLSIGFNQTSLSNWAAGGYNTATLSTGIDGKANYKKDLMSWNNRIQLNYGFLHSSDKKGILQKSNDRIYFESKWAYQTKKDSKWDYAASFDFRSQFTDTPKKYIQDAESGKWSPDGIKSGFLSPAYTNLALGLEWKPTSWFDLNMAPLTGGFTIVRNALLRKNYGMELACEADDPGYLEAVAAKDNALIGSFYRKAKFQFGAQIKTDMKFVINSNLKYETQLVLFTDYLDHPFEWTRVNWDNKISFKFARNFNIAFNTWLIYDPIVMIADEDGSNARQRIQLKEFISFSFAYTFRPREKK